MLSVSMFQRRCNTHPQSTVYNQKRTTIKILPGSKLSTFTINVHNHRNDNTIVHRFVHRDIDPHFLDPRACPVKLFFSDSISSTKGGSDCPNLRPNVVIVSNEGVVAMGVAGSPPGAASEGCSNEMRSSRPRMSPSSWSRGSSVPTKEELLPKSDVPPDVPL